MKEKKTFPRVTKLLLENAVQAGSVNAVVRKTGLSHNTVTGYIEGRTEPSHKSLELIGQAYGKTVAWLRNDKEEDTPIPPA